VSKVFLAFYSVITLKSSGQKLHVLLPKNSILLLIGVGNKPDPLEMDLFQKVMFYHLNYSSQSTLGQLSGFYFFTRALYVLGLCMYWSRQPLLHYKMLKCAGVSRWLCEG